MQTARHADTGLSAVLEDLVPMVRRMATAGGLSVAAATVLATLTREGPLRLTELAARASASQPGMTQLAARLERDGLVRRIADRHDGRAVLVEVTAAGRELVRRRRSERAVAVQRLLGRLSAAERSAIQDALPALSRLIQLSHEHPHGDR